MAGFSSLAIAGNSLIRLLSLRFAEQSPVPGTTVALVRTEDLEPANQALLLPRPVLTLFLYRTDFNKTMRAAWSAAAYYDNRSHLALDLHFLLTAWGNNAEEEYLILGRAMQVIEDHPILSGPMLSGGTDWEMDDAVQLVMEDIDTESLMRIFDSLPVDYRLSLPYIARIVRIDGAAVTVDPPVVTAILGARAGSN